MNLHSPAVGVASGLGAAAIWGAMFVVSKAVLPVVPPFTLLSLRLILGAAALGLVAWVLRKPHPVKVGLPGPRRWLRVLGAGFVGYGVSLAFQFVGTDLGTAADGALITCATPAFLALFAGPILHEKVGPRAWAALGLASAGVGLVLAPSLAGTGASGPVGPLMLTGAALTWGLYTVLTARVAKNLDLTLSTLVGFLGGLPVSLAGASWEIAAGKVGTIDGGIVAGILFLGLVSTALAMFLWNHAFQVLPASAAGLTFFAQPVTGVLLATLFLGEIPGPMFYAGAALIAGALVFGRNR